MLTIHKFVFNHFSQNTYLLFDETKEAVVVDPGCYFPEEQEEISAFITKNELTLKKIIFTHCHLDHAFGSNYMHKTYPEASVEAHKEEEFFVREFLGQAARFGIQMEQPASITKNLNEDDLMEFGNTKLEMLHTPGHSKGSICFYHKETDQVIVGDVIFMNGMGRTDLVGGSLEELIDSIKNKLFTLPDKTIVYSGHGPETTIGHEKISNPVATERGLWH